MKISTRLSLNRKRDNVTMIVLCRLDRNLSLCSFVSLEEHDKSTKWKLKISEKGVQFPLILE